MAKKVIQKSKLRILLNAEPFGFGPTAAIATLFPGLRERFAYVGYIGKGHTLDLQQGLPYDAIHDLSGLNAKEEKEYFQKIGPQYDIFFTALDFEAATYAKESGLRVIIYDPLTWYWKIIPPIVGASALYITQDFFGVRERIASDASLFPETRIVPPLVSGKKTARGGKHVLVNLGGLQNPLQSLKETAAYANTIIDLLKVLVPANERIIIAASSLVKGHLRDTSARKYSRKEMYTLLSGAKYAFMTPGLGNIYDAAKFNVPTMWLPPANDSQGQQADILEREHLLDARVDWKEIIPAGIDYAKEQTAVLREITLATHFLEQGGRAREEFVKAFDREYDKMKGYKVSRTNKLLHMFGTGGEEQILTIVAEYAQKLAHNIMPQ